MVSSALVEFFRGVARDGERRGESMGSPLPGLTNHDEDNLIKRLE
jgi:hypothetical protein